MTVPGEVGFLDGAAVLDFDVAWIHGSEAAKYNTDPDIQVHACDEHTYILCQNMAVSYAAPFMFLLFGASRAVLLDTGATANPEFGFADDPDLVAEVDLGGRVLDCLATPGHHQAAVTYYDRYSGILFTGDTVYPGRLSVCDWTGFARSIGPPLELTTDHLAQIQDTLRSHDLKPDRYVLPQVIITPAG